MLKHLRSLFLCGLILFAASVTVSATGSAELRSPTNPAYIKYLVAPKLFNCDDEKPTVIISYKWDPAFRFPKSDDSGELAPLAPLTPLDPLAPSTGSTGATSDDPLPGRIVTTGTIGTVEDPDKPVDTNEGAFVTHYLPGGTGPEILKSTLTYSPYSNYTQAGFNVATCQYRLVINAENEQEAEGGAYTTSSFISAGGNLSLDSNGNIQGDLDVDAGFLMTIDNEVEVCLLTPLPYGSGRATVSGQMVNPTFGEPYLSLTVSYKAIVGFSKAEFVCVNKKNGDTFTAPSPIQPPKSVNPAEYLLTELNFSNGSEITGGYGDGGHAVYYLMKRS